MYSYVVCMCMWFMLIFSLNQNDNKNIIKSRDIIWTHEYSSVAKVFLQFYANAQYDVPSENIKRPNQSI